MGLEAEGRRIRWRVSLAASPEQVYRALSTPEGRASFWAVSAFERDGIIAFRFRSGQVIESRVLEREPPRRFVITYFGGSRAAFTLEPTAGGGTDLTLTETDVPEAEMLENLPGWVSVLLNLKAAVDFGVDLRNTDPGKRWERGFVDV